MLCSIFITYIITHHGLGGFSGLINGLIAAAIGALSMLMSEPIAESYVKRTCMFVLSIATFTFTFTLQNAYSICFCSCECSLNEEKAMEKRDEIKQGYDDLKKQLAEFTGTVIMLHHFYQNKIE